MKVKELREKLEGMPQEAEVKYRTEENIGYCPIDQVEFEYGDVWLSYL